MDDFDQTPGMDKVLAGKMFPDDTDLANKWQPVLGAVATLGCTAGGLAAGLGAAWLMGGTGAGMGALLGAGIGAVGGAYWGNQV